MDWSLWPQYLVAFWLSIQVLAQFADGRDSAETAGLVVGYAIINGVTAYVLYCGGFWS